MKTVLKTFCSEIARSVEPELAGTASCASECLVLSYPKRFWKRDALASEGISEELQSLFRELGKTRDMVVRLVNHKGEWTGRTDLYLFPVNRMLKSVLWEQVPEVLQALLDQKTDWGSPIDRSLLLCCTHGVRDRCCARFGGELFRSLAERAEVLGLPFDVFEASHLGGDRFAPIVLSLPTGHMYGHLHVDDVDELLQCEHEKAVFLRKFRGTIWFDSLQQLAEVALYGLPYSPEERPLVGPVDTKTIDDEHCILYAKCLWRKTTFLLIVECEYTEIESFSDCQSVDDGTSANLGRWKITRTYGQELIVKKK